MTTKARNNVSPILLKQVDAVEILCLQDNFIDNASFDSNQIVQRASPSLVLSKGILAEHGFSVLVSTVVGHVVHRVPFDFGLSEYGAAYHNAEALNVDLSQVEAMVLPHGHIDHFGGILPFARNAILLAEIQHGLPDERVRPLCVPQQRPAIGEVHSALLRASQETRSDAPGCVPERRHARAGAAIRG